MATYENSITLARVFDGVDASSRNTIVLSAEEILKYSTTEAGAQSLTYAPTPLKLTLKQNGSEINVASILDKLNINVEYIGIDEEEGVTISNLQDNNVKTLKQYHEQKLGTNNALRGLVVYSYEANSLILNINEIDNDNKYYFTKTVEEGAGNYKLTEKYRLIYISTTPKEERYFNEDVQYYKLNDNVYVPINNLDEDIDYYIKQTTFELAEKGDYNREESASIAHLIKLINISDGFFRVSISWGQEEAVTAFPVRFAVSSELAKFSVHAAGINAAVGGAGLKFDGNGLTIENGNFKIVKTEGSEATNLLYSEDGNLVIKGKVFASSGEFKGKVIATEGEFKGKVTATEGEFNGKINASEGTIGGFNITTNMISSEDKDIQLITEVRNLADGTEYSTSKIIANNIELGSGANIADQINIGDSVFLYNPKKHNDQVLVAGGTVLNSNGSLKIASVDAKGWSVSESGIARFDKIIINSAEIGTSTLQVDTVQSVGGTMIFRPSYPVSALTQDDNDSTKIWLTIDMPEGFSIGDNERIWLTCGNEKILTKIRVDSTTHEYYIQQAIDLDTKFKNNETIVTLLGNNDLIFTISSKDNGIYNNDYINLPTEDWIRPASLTLGEFTTKSADSTALVEDNQELENQSDIFKYHLILGKLANNSYGLLADNVILNGSLTTKVMKYADKDGKEHYTYAGINTLGQATFTKSKSELNPDKSKIVFWAGSESDSTDHIQEAPFQVTEEGTLYAQQGYFKGSIITEANISASKISAASFWAKDANAALKLYNTASSNGILFMEAKPDIDGNFVPADDDKYSFGINATGFYLPTYNYFISCADDLSGVNIEAIKIDAQQLNSNELNLSSSNPKIVFQDLDETGSTKGSIEYNQGIQLRISDGPNLEILKNGNIALNSNQTLINNKVSFIGTGATLEYRATDKDQEDKGYDLYVII